jgi:hypothetical protein
MASFPLISSHSFRENGVICNVKTSDFDGIEEVKEGTVLTVRYSGLWKKSLKFKYPVLLRVNSMLE